MKKTILVAVVFAAMILGMTSCENKDTKQCWKMEAICTVGESSMTSARYCWKSQNEMDAEVKKYQDNVNAMNEEFLDLISALIGEPADSSMVSMKVSYTKASSYKTESDCNAQTEKDNFFDEIDDMLAGK